MAHTRNGRRQRPSASRYTVDELAERTDLTPRTIRSYQTQGLLPPPERHGRVAYYDDSHLERLQEIAELKEEGLSLSSIPEVLTRREAATRAKAARTKARSIGDATSRSSSARSSAARSSSASSSAGAGDERPAVAAPFRYTGAVKPVSAVGTGAGTALVPALGKDPLAKTKDGGDKDSGSPKRRPVLVASVVLVLLLTIAAVSSVLAVLSLSDADNDRERLGRQVSDLRGDLSKLDANQGPPVTVVVPGPVQQAPETEPPPTTAAPVTRTVVVTTPRQVTGAPSPAPPANTAPATTPTTRCTLNVLGSICVP